MIMADVFKVLFLVVGGLMCTVCYWLIFQALFAEKVEGCRKAILARPIRVLMTGGLVGIPLSLLGFALMSSGAGPFVFLGGAVLSAITLFSLFGATGIVRHIGGQLSADSEMSAGILVLRGGAVLSTACVLPIVGWFFLIPVILITGFGASVAMLWSRRKVTATPPVVEAVQA